MTDLELQTKEEQLKDENDMFLVYCQDFEITDESTWLRAGNGVKELKKKQKIVKDFFEPLRQAAKKNYDAVLGKIKENMNPLKEAESVLKNKMVNYQVALEHARREQEKALREQAQAESDKLLAEAAELENAGDLAGADAAMAEAEVMDAVAVAGAIEKAKLKNEGVSTRKAWKITAIDEDKVPITLNGIVIRPVDEKAIMAMIKTAKGNIEIPGVQFEETVIIAARG